MADDTVEKMKWSTRQPTDITPEQKKLQARWKSRNDAEHVGNIGWLFGNWGLRAKDRQKREHVDEVLKKQPAMVIGLAECQKETEMVLQQDPAAVAAAPKTQAKSKFTSRPEFQYLTFRGNEESSVLIAVRDQAGSALELLKAERLCHGQTKKKGQSRSKAWAYSRSIIAKVTLPHNVGFLGKRTLSWWCTCTTRSPMVDGQVSS